MMSKIIIGCDPDSHKSGMSFYIGGKLLRLECMTLVSIFLNLNQYQSNGRMMAQSFTLKMLTALALTHLA
ncbi:Holliday junction resolvase [Pseudoalteromonas phage HS1]|uniref:Holliday junction resolvase n=1 Tax=Pseudoalteromonas phage HS5 TaxID=1357709 RepID=UPI0023296F40|nr:Holliday junction resolvase [Pseudoalteromonas phage HS5]YP_010660213.1 Holliday junction resolvase [Pseudoalteromonas phage HS1]